MSVGPLCVEGTVLREASVVGKGPTEGKVCCFNGQFRGSKATWEPCKQCDVSGYDPMVRMSERMW